MKRPALFAALAVSAVLIVAALGDIAIALARPLAPWFGWLLP
jgi:hypothetical protein